LAEIARQAAGSKLDTWIRIAGYAVAVERPSSELAPALGLHAAMAVRPAAGSWLGTRVRITRDTEADERPTEILTELKTVDTAISVVTTARAVFHTAIRIAVVPFEPIDALAFVLGNIDATAAFEAACTRAWIRITGGAGTQRLTTRCQARVGESELTPSPVETTCLEWNTWIRIAGIEGHKRNAFTEIRRDYLAGTVGKAADGWFEAGLEHL
jgi:hypothetical protein